MLTIALTVTTLVATPSLSSEPTFKLAMAAALLAGANQPRYEEPTPQEIKPVNPQPLEATTLPAPVMTPRMPSPAPTDLAELKPQALPAPLPNSRMAQATSQEEILKRLERLEEENRRLRQQQQQNPPTSPPAQPGAPIPQRLSAQMVPGWRVSLYEWNAEGNTSRDPMKVFQIRNQRFTARLGQREVARNDRSIPRLYRREGHTGEMFVYKLDGFLNITKPGSYQLGYEVNCGFQHPCSLVVKVGGQQVFAERNRNYDNKLVFQERDFKEAGAYPVEVTFHMTTSKFMKFDPDRVSIYPQIRGPGEYNFRDFNANELVVESNSGIPTGVPR